MLVAVAIPTFGSQLEKARQATDKANLRDAYAAAKLAVLNQDDENGLKDVATTDKTFAKLSSIVEAETLATKYVYFGFDGDNLTYDDAATGITAGNLTDKTIIGKATTASVIGDEALPKGIVYSDGTIKTLPTYSTTATAQKGIVVCLKFDKDTRAFTFEGVTFMTTIPAAGDSKNAAFGT